MEWQPIKTAPKNGTWILLCGGKATEDIGSVYERLSTYDRKRPCVGKWLDDEKDDDIIDCGWVTGYWDSMWYNKYENPTHWMPLPEPPANMQKSLEKLIEELEEISLARMNINPITRSKYHKLDEVKKLIEILTEINNKLNKKEDK